VAFLCKRKKYTDIEDDKYSISNIKERCNMQQSTDYR